MPLEIELSKQGNGSYALDIEKLRALLMPVKAEMEESAAGVLDKIPAWKAWNVPVGDALKGMVTAGVGDAVGVLALKFIPSNIIGGQYAVPMLKILTILGLNWKPVKHFIGSGAVEVGSIILAYEAIASLFNVRQKTFSLLSGVLGKLPGTTTASTTSTPAGIIQTI